ncbi:putative cytochrome P450 [Pseudomassariella vexata]|uniref:Putative cytochrome P450 n=1 Tax=Pseudomassariella vexata TaxID=1141098 RepID=A0A1Y2EKA2_9PEZI|nr:putative cytochrome P450 [Pseudomassariella vexata]ORY71962.1 putative cytochrome P450 [Pseudomassariella vexata]
MESINCSFDNLRELVDGHYAPRGLLIIVLCVTVLVVLTLHLKAVSEPRALADPIPFIFNTIQFVTDNERFMHRVSKALEKANSARFYLGWKEVYLLAGPRNIQTIFGRLHDKIGNEDIMVRSVLPNLYRMSKDEVKRFADDHSGRGRLPAPGTENITADQRYWRAYEHYHTEYLVRTNHLKPMIEFFRCQFSSALERRYPVDEWTTISVMDLCRSEITECAISTLFGPSIFELNPGLLDAFWAFDANLFTLTLGFPAWLNPRPYRIRDRYYAMIGKYLDAAWSKFDWNGPSAEVFWEPLFGARVCREIVKWLKDDGFQAEAAAGALGMLLMAQNSNSIPTTMWMIMEITKDPSLLQAIRDEVATAHKTDLETGALMIDSDKLVTLPLLQSVFTEVLRMHINFNIIRHVKEPIAMKGFVIGKGSMLQVPMLVPHYDESVWGVEGHPAKEFWAGRHLKYVEDTDESGSVSRKLAYSMAGRSNSFFPFGGGQFICPGRHFAKYEILTTIALVVSKFDIEFIEWTKLDGSPSDRPARNDARYCGAGAMPPDRDMKIRWKRIS